MSSFDLSRETKRRAAIHGGTNICPWCDSQRVRGSSFCLAHKRQYQRDWAKKRSDELKRLRAMLGGVQVSICEFPEPA